MHCCLITARPCDEGGAGVQYHLSCPLMHQHVLLVTPAPAAPVPTPQLAFCARPLRPLPCSATPPQVVDGSAGVDCTLVPAASAPSTSASSPATPTPAAAPSGKVPQPKLRFLEGQVDEVSFLAPELGPLVGVLVGVEQGTWLLDEVTISSSRSAHIDRYERVWGAGVEGVGVLVGVEQGTWL